MFTPPTFRHKMYAEYKGTRKPMADELRQQVPVIKEVLHAMGVKTIECAGLEADDLIGTLSNRCENEVWKLPLFPETAICCNLRQSM